MDFSGPVCPARHELGGHRCVADGARAGQLRGPGGVDGTGDGDAPHNAEATHEAPRGRRQRRVLVGQRGQQRREHGPHAKARAEGLEHLEAHPGARARVLVQEREDAKADDDQGEAKDENGLVAAELAEQQPADDGAREECEDGGEKMDAGVVGIYGENALEVDREEVECPHSDDAVEKGEEEDDGAHGIAEEVEGHDGIWRKAGIAFEHDEGSHRGQTDNERHEDLIRWPRVLPSCPAKGNQHRDGAADEEGVPQPVEARKLSGPRLGFVILDLQKGNQQHNRNTANGQSYIESPAPGAVADEQSAKERAEGGSDADHAKHGGHVGTSLAERHQVADDDLAEDANARASDPLYRSTADHRGHVGGSAHYPSRQQRLWAPWDEMAPRPGTEEAATHPPQTPLPIVKRAPDMIRGHRRPNMGIREVLHKLSPRIG